MPMGSMDENDIKGYLAINLSAWTGPFDLGA